LNAYEDDCFHAWLKLHGARFYAKEEGLVDDRISRTGAFVRLVPLVRTFLSGTRKA
jgi:hypothetical protein